MVAVIIVDEVEIETCCLLPFLPAGVLLPFQSALALSLLVALLSKFAYGKLPQLWPSSPSLSSAVI